MRTSRSVCIAAAMAVMISAGVSRAQTGSKFTSKQAEVFVKAHNEVRKAAGVKVKVAWDKEIASFAQAWADELASKGQFKHRPRTGKWKQKYGENLWAGSASFHKVSQAVAAWASEKKYYNNEPISQANFLKVGHYTQVIWERTTKIGAGLAIDKKTDKLIVVCNYSPPGNQPGKRPVTNGVRVLPKKTDPPAIKPAALNGGQDNSRDLKGELNNDVRKKEYHVKMEQGTAYTINLTSNQFDTYLRLYDENGVQIAKDDDGGAGFNSRLVFTPPKSGVYKLVVDSYGGKGKGAYLLSMAASKAGPIRTFEGALDAANPKKNYSVKMSLGHSYAIDLTSSQFDTYLRIFDANGVQIARNDDGGAGFNSRLVFTPPKPGVYKVVVDSYLGKGRGIYTLSIRSIAGAASGNSKTLVPPQNVAGALSAAVRKQAYRIKMKQGASYTIHLTSQQFDTYLRVLDSNGQQIAIDDDGGPGLNSRLVFTAPQSGVYSVVVDSYAGRGLGTYDLKVVRSSN